MSPRDLVALFALAAIWGGSFLFIRVAVPALGPFPLVAGRVGLAAFVLLVGMRVVGYRPAIRGNVGKLLTLGAMNAALPFVLISAAELHITASLAAMLHASAPLWAVLFAAIWLGEPVTRRRGVGVAVGCVGVAVLVGWSPVALTPATILAVLAMLAATAAYALSGIFVKKRLAGVPPLTLSLGQQMGAFAWIALPAAWQLPTATPTPKALGAVAALAVLSTAAAYPLFFWLMGRVGPTKVATLTYIVPVFGSAWGVLFLDEPVTRGMFAGLALVLGSVVLVNDIRLPRLRAPQRSACATEATQAPTR